MGVRTYEGLCEVHQGPDGGGLHTQDYPAEGSLLMLESLVQEAAGVSCPDDVILHGIESEGDVYWAPFYKEKVERWRRESGKQYPPIYQVKISVEAKALPDEESAAYWQRRQQET